MVTPKVSFTVSLGLNVNPGLINPKRLFHWESTIKKYQIMTIGGIPPWINHGLAKSEVGINVMARKKILDIMGNIAIIILYHVISIYNGQYTMMISPNCCPARPQGRTAAPSLPRWLHARRRSTWQSCPATPWRWKDIICIYIYDLYIYTHKI